MRLDLDRSTWKLVRFGDVVINRNESVRDPAAAGIDRVIAMEHLDPRSLKVDRWGDPSEGTTFTRRVRPGQTLFGKRRAYQRKVAYADFDAICSGDILVFEARPDLLLPKFLPLLASSDGFFRHAMETSAGSLSPRTRWSDLALYEFLLPPLDLQSELTGLVDSLNSEADAAVDLKLLAGRVAETYERAAILETNKFPRLSDHVSSSAYGPRFAGELYDVDGGYRVLRTSDIDQAGVINYESLPAASLSDGMAHHVLESGDFLITRSGMACGTGLVWEDSKIDRPTVPGAFLIRLRLKQSLSPDYLKAVVNSSVGDDILRTLLRGGVQKNIRGSSLLATRFPIPERSIQDDILSRFENIASAGRWANERLDAAQRLRTQLSHRIFGEVE